MSDIDRLKLTLYGYGFANHEAIAVWRNFANHSYFNDNSPYCELAQYNARFTDSYSELIFDSEDDKLEFLLTWS
jgi:hypothetical protein